MKTIGTSVTKRMLSPVSRGCKQNLTLAFFTIPILSILLYSACGSENRKVPPSGPIRFKDPPPTTNNGPGPTTNNAPSNPIMITTYAELKAVKNGLAKHYRLGNDIDASPSRGEGASNCVAYNGNNGAIANCRGFTPIGRYIANNNNVAFTGSFDGAGHKITNLYIKRETTNNVGLFGYTGTSAEIKNIGVTDAYVVGNSEVGGLIGQVRGSVSNSYATGAVTGRGNNVGGLIGWASSSAGSVSNSYTTGTVTGMGDSVGGFIGRSFGSVINSYAMGTVTGRDHIGGLIGDSNSGSSVSNSYATGDVTGMGSSEVGGLLGRSDGSVSNSYATGAVMGTGNVGGLIGFFAGTAGSVTNGRNYFVDGSGTDGIGGGNTCSSSVCVSQTVGQIAALTSTSGWTISTSGTTGNWDFGTTTQLPAVLYSGAGCEETIATNDINSNEGDTSIPDCGDIIKGQR